MGKLKRSRSVLVDDDTDVAMGEANKKLKYAVVCFAGNN